MISLYQLALELQNLFIQNKWRFSFIGGIALQRWGEPRLTVDIDVTLLTGFGNEEKYVDQLLKHYNGRLDDTKTFALTNRVLLLQSSQIAIDIALGGLSFEELVVTRSTFFEFIPSVSLVTCSAEDLVVLKAFADRNRDWADIEGIIIRQGTILDFEYVLKQLTPLCDLKESPEIMQKLQQMYQKLS
jgi:hypothetical protein